MPGVGERSRGTLRGALLASATHTKTWSRKRAKRRSKAGISRSCRRGSASALPVRDSGVDLVLNRHGALDATEIARVLGPGGVLLTQQVGSRNDVAFNDALRVPSATALGAHTLGTVVDALESAGMVVDRAEEEFPARRFLDIGAVVFQLLAVPWQVPGFDVDTFDRPLREIDAEIRARGSFTVRNHRFLVRARKP